MMDKSYLIDIFLSGCLWLWLLFLAVDVKVRLKRCNQAMNSAVFGLTATQVVKRSSLLWLPLFLVQLFLLWRFYSTLVFFESFGAGAAGLLVIVGVAAAILLWLNLLLISVQHVRYSEFQKLEQSVQNTRQPMPPMNQGGRL